MINHYEHQYEPFLRTRSISKPGTKQQADHEQFLTEVQQIFDAQDREEAMMSATSPSVNTKNSSDGPEPLNSELMYAVQDVITKAKGASIAVIDVPANSTLPTVSFVTPLSMDDETPASSPSISAVKHTLPELEGETAQEIVADYYFPDSTFEDDLDTDHADLMDELEFLVDQVNRPNDYLAIRDRYCRVALILNSRGLWAPAFRTDLKIPWKDSDRKPAHTLIHRDRIVIDCHWLYGKGYKICPTEKTWRQLFKLGKPFSVELASEFAKREITNEYRAEAILSLTIRQQCQLRTMRGLAAARQFQAIFPYQRLGERRIPPSMEIITLTVNRWCEQDRRIESHREKYLAHAKARALLSTITPTWKEIAELAGLIRGVLPLGDGTVRDFMGKLDKRVSKSA